MTAYAPLTWGVCRFWGQSLTREYLLRLTIAAISGYFHDCVKGVYPMREVKTGPELLAKATLILQDFLDSFSTSCEDVNPAALNAATKTYQVLHGMHGDTKPPIDPADGRTALAEAGYKLVLIGEDE